MMANDNTHVLKDDHSAGTPSLDSLLPIGRWSVASQIITIS